MSQPKPINTKPGVRYVRDGQLVSKDEYETSNAKAAKKTGGKGTQADAPAAAPETANEE